MRGANIRMPAIQEPRREFTAKGGSARLIVAQAEIEERKQWNRQGNKRGKAGPFRPIRKMLADGGAANRRLGEFSIPDRTAAVNSLRNHEISGRDHDNGADGFG